MQKKEIDVILSLSIIAILFFGLIMVSSVSVYPSYTLTSTMVSRGVLSEPNNSYFMVRTFVYVILGIAAMITFSKIPYYYYEKYAKPIFFGSIVFLLLVFVPGIKSVRNGANGWIDIPGLPSIQPVEFAKLGLIIMLAYFLKKRKSVMKDLHKGFLSFFVICAGIIIPLVFQPDFGSILIIGVIILIMYYTGGGSGKFLGIAFGILLLGAASVYGIGKWQQLSYQKQAEMGIVTQDKNLINFGYITTRVDNFFRDNKEIAQSKEKGTDHQLRNAFIALGSGGFFGLGFGASIQKFGYLPEVHGDFIFCVIVEEWGFVGGVLVIVFYLLIAYRGYNIARSVKDIFGKYLAFGVTTWFIVQAFINIGVNMNVVPLTGVTLPFVSFGGTSILSLSVAAGILLSISRHIEVKPPKFSSYLQSGRNITF